MLIHRYFKRNWIDHRLNDSRGLPLHREASIPWNLRQFTDLSALEIVKGEVLVPRLYYAFFAEICVQQVLVALNSF